MVGRRRRAPDVESADVRPLAYPAGRPPVAPPASAAGLSAGQPRAIAPPHTLTTPAQGRCPLSTTDPTSPQFFGAASAGAGAADVELSRRQRAHVDTWGMDTPHTEAPRLRLDVVAALAVVAAVALYAWATISTVRAARAALDRLGGPAGWHRRRLAGGRRPRRNDRRPRRRRPRPGRRLTSGRKGGPIKVPSPGPRHCRRALGRTPPAVGEGGALTLRLARADPAPHAGRIRHTGGRAPRQRSRALPASRQPDRPGGRRRRRGRRGVRPDRRYPRRLRGAPRLGRDVARLPAAQDGAPFLGAADAHGARGARARRRRRRRAAARRRRRPGPGNRRHRRRRCPAVGRVLGPRRRGARAPDGRAGGGVPQAWGRRRPP